MKISLIMPGRNNLRYAKWSYDSIQKNKGDHTVQICFADDASTDGTWEWCVEMMKVDSNFKAIRNEGPERVGHTILYDRLVNEVCTNDLAMIWHCDMYLAPGALDAIEKQMYNAKMAPRKIIKEQIPKRIVSLTRIEPPLHPPGPEKIVNDFGDEPDNFNEEGFLTLINSKVVTVENKGKTTKGVFAPWAFWVEDFKAVGGHDPLFAPQSKEDSDIWNRLLLNGCEFIQTWQGFVYHLTSRGNRRNVLEGAPNARTNNPAWERQNIISSRNFIRKWGSFVKHDEYIHPIVVPKYTKTLIMTNANMRDIVAWEPWFDNIIVCKPTLAMAQKLVDEYCTVHQGETLYKLSVRLAAAANADADDLYASDDVDHIVCLIDSEQMNQDYVNIFMNFNEILSTVDGPGEYQFNLLNVNVHLLEDQLARPFTDIDFSRTEK